MNLIKTQQQCRLRFSFSLALPLSVVAVAGAGAGGRVSTSSCLFRAKGKCNFVAETFDIFVQLVESTRVELLFVYTSVERNDVSLVSDMTTD